MPSYVVAEAGHAIISGSTHKIPYLISKNPRLGLYGTRRPLLQIQTHHANRPVTAIYHS